jgi:hypothetical protein
MLWECYANLLNDTARLTFDEAQDRMKRYLVAGYKMTPSTPTLIEARDALLAAMAAQDSSDHALCQQGFAKRGAGAGRRGAGSLQRGQRGRRREFRRGGRACCCVGDDFRCARLLRRRRHPRQRRDRTLSIAIENTGGIALVATTGSVSSGNAHVSFPGGTALAIPPTNPGQSVTVTIPIRLTGASGRGDRPDLRHARRPGPRHRGAR